jgi:AraC-like DNA-binding protein
MKTPEVRLFKEPDKSFIFYHEKNTFTPWHHHEEYEFCLILRGNGVRMIGDHVDRFASNDLVLVGPNLPHEWKCDNNYYGRSGDFLGEGIALQFLTDFLGEQFYRLAENKGLNKCLERSRLGCLFYGKTKTRIIEKMIEMLEMEGPVRLYKLLSIFGILACTNEYRVLSSPLFLEQYRENNNEPLRKTVQYIHQNFQRKIKTEELLEICNMSNTTFFENFKKTYRMSYKRYLLNLRVGYACRLLSDETLNISRIAFESGFENLSNFNRQFKQIKSCTPREYKKHITGDKSLQLEAV